MAKGSQAKIEDLGDIDNGADDKSKSKDTSARKRKPRSTKSDTELRNRLTECFDRIADALTDRGDVELGEAIRDDAEVMAGGLVSATRPFRLVRLIVLAVVAVIEPLLAFGRIGRILIGRFAERRQRVAVDRETYDTENVVGGP